jgi:hypothetical protein
MGRFPQPELWDFAIDHRIRIGSVTKTSWTERGGFMKAVKRVRDPDETADMSLVGWVKPTKCFQS